MKPHFLGFITALILYALSPSTFSQNLPGLGIQIYSGLSITGSVNRVYILEYTTNLTVTKNWQCLEFVATTATNLLWLDTTAPATSGGRFYRAVEFDAPTNLVFIPPGVFRMGSPTNETDRSSDEGPQRAITISSGFWMGKYEVTQQEYESVMGVNPSFFNGYQAVYDVDYGTNLSRPVEQVSWIDATDFCSRLTQAERGSGRIPTNCSYRLPTEAEWEYASRAWTSDRRFSYGDDIGYTNLSRYAWYAQNSDYTTQSVGQKQPNPWGLHDVYGNVWEWCQDLRLYALQYRAVRGGGIESSGDDCRSARRGGSYQGHGSYLIGFRIVLAKDQP